MHVEVTMMIQHKTLYYASMLLNKLKSFYHGEARPAHERIKPLRFIIGFAIPITLGFVVFNYHHGFPVLALTQGCLIVFLMLPTYLLLANEKNIGLCELLTMITAFLGFASLIIVGGYLGTGINWAFIFPFLAFYLNKQRDAWQWSIAFFIFMLACALFSRFHLISIYYATGQLDLFCSTFVFYTLTAFVLTTLRNQYALQLEQQVTVRVQDLRTANEKLLRRLFYDAVTDIPNRYLFDKQLKQMLVQAKEKETSLAVIVFEVDRFQDINNTLGYRNGDSVLQQIVSRIRPVIRCSDVFARIGGANFAITLPSASTQDATKVAKKIFRVAGEAFLIEGNLIEMSLSIGIAAFPEHADQTDLLLQRADVAMRQANVGGINEVILYQRDMDTCNVRHLRLFGKLRQAITDKQLKLVYQAKVDFSTDKVSSVEALVRWHDQDEGFISPAEFIPLAEKSGLIIQLTSWVLAESIQQCALWHGKGMTLAVSINISTRDLLHSHFQQSISELLQKHHLDAKYITLEITETSLMEHPERALQVLQSLRDMGLFLSIDDFGTGYSSLAYLKELPVNELKIDQSFIFHLRENKSDELIVQSTINLAHGFGLKVVAEGIENIENMTILKQMGCDKAQGYSMNRPLEALAFEKWLNSSAWANNTPT